VQSPAEPQQQQSLQELAAEAAAKTTAVQACHNYKFPKKLTSK
jgi:hypothetical protein